MQEFIKRFDELSAEESYEIIKVRVGVFVVEQNCPYQDLDDVDKEAYHVYLKEDGKIVAYLRVVDKGKRLNEVSVGRVISLKRRCGDSADVAWFARCEREIWHDEGHGGRANVCKSILRTIGILPNIGRIFGGRDSAYLYDL